MKIKITAILFFIIIILGVGGLFYCVDVIKQPFIDKNSDIEVNVKKGESLYNLLEKLKKEQIIKNDFLVKVYVKNKKLPTKIKPGVYIFKEKINTEEFISKLNEGNKNEDIIKVTIPEGYEINQIADTLEMKGILSKDEFIKSVLEYPLPDYIMHSEERRYDLEGYLFPDTYNFKKGMKGNEIITIMIKRFENIKKDIENKLNVSIKKENMNEIITMASLVEKEAFFLKEKPKVASVFYNRLKKGIRLQSDITVLYALNMKKERVLYKDLEVDSPYNTYKVNGLPIGPVCNPGRTSIEAALAPEKSNNLYFIIIKDGPHLFTDSYNEFLKVKNEWIKNR